MAIYMKLHNCTPSHQNAVKLEVDLTITNPIISNNFRNLLADLWVGSVHLQGNSQSLCILLSFSFNSLRFQLARNFFHLFTCNFTRICFGFLKKTLWFFPMVFEGNPTHFIPEECSDQKDIQNPVKHLRWCALRKQLTPYMFDRILNRLLLIYR